MKENELSFNKTNIIQGFQGIRGLAILLIIISHCS
jgi:peptidoglycan/LPS O-acetylase OafA/YrhL